MRFKLPGLSLLKGNMTNEVTALEKLQSLTTDYIGWTESSLKATAVVLLLNEVLFNNRTRVVEFGSGVSTYYIAKILEQKNSGHLYSFESDPYWLSIVESQIRKANLEHRVTLVLARLKETAAGLKGCHWYDTSIVEGALPNGVDMVLVDGPPAYKKSLEFSRYPAIP